MRRRSHRSPRRRGFTLLELLTVVLIIGILASIAITKFGDSKKRAYLAAMQADLRNLASMAEAQFTVDNSYAGFVAPQGSDGVTLTFSGTATTWSATATHSGVTGVVCTLGNGPDSPAQPECH